MPLNHGCAGSLCACVAEPEKILSQRRVWFGVFKQGTPSVNSRVRFSLFKCFVVSYAGALVGRVLFLRCFPLVLVQ